MAAAGVPKRPVKFPGETRSITTSYRVLLCSDGVYSGYDAWSRNGFPTYKGAALAPTAYVNGGTDWNAGAAALRPWRVPLDAPFDVSAITLKGQVTRRIYSNVLGTNGNAWLGNTAYLCGAPISPLAVPMVRLFGLQQSQSSNFVHGRLDAWTGERTYFTPNQQFQQLPVEIRLLDCVSDGIFIPHLLERPLGAAGAGVANEVIYTITITLHRALRSDEDADLMT